jgi:hypothetical protein
VKLKQGHWACIAFAIVAVFIIMHAKLGYNQSASVSIDSGLVEAAVSSAAFA